MLDIQVCAGEGFLAASQSKTEVRGKPFLMNWLILKLRESPSYPLLLQLMKPGSIMLNRDKRQSIRLHHPQSPWKEESKNSPLVKKAVTTVFWDSELVIFIDVMPRWETVNSDA